MYHKKNKPDINDLIAAKKISVADLNRYDSITIQKLNKLARLIRADKVEVNNCLGMFAWSNETVNKLKMLTKLILAKKNGSTSLRRHMRLERTNCS